ncbi:response regulator transcription factor [Pedobacter polaris]|uniref:Response regulator transcription factor n=1 Tax=Pedobacter polaris TaxID=2571273 RepID=A0A4U1CG00_9SPHI|nr:LytTR family DNA-binding domain-containing protein [Pedobacter polaris]TKC04626.1 response regulator transcription factor [Pedobacter polaris]
MIKCIIVDDKPLAIDVLKNYVAKVPFLELCLSTTNPLEALEKVIEGGIDLVFLDIQMPELSGLQFIKIIKGRCQVIFTTAYSEYALDGFENNAIDYLLKPVSFERFYKAVEKSQFLLNALEEQKNDQNLPLQEKEINHIFVKTEYKLIRINTENILYVEGMQNYVTFYTATEKVISLQTMKKTEEQLPSSQFLRIHKSFIVAINKIDSIERNRVQIGDQNITIGEIYRDAFYSAINNN